MSGQNSEDPNHFGRRSVTSDRTDPFESMREQMEKERENFFKGVNPRDWPNENNTGRGGLFNRVCFKFYFTNKIIYQLIYRHKKNQNF